ncbi:tryptophan 7-halogenase [Duganella dendranthematis]|uniref:Tryptophan 7-halogenase n=1 Tax=Duganella dendranthematis TaxID=2728021 RepID=A0ABX6M6F9_9BURK|nr:tryptophan halogenase family protein [Duganella dendranthematis]QJD89566.1 tryptophan 7-halogenase [Duganella dendranthematis]
MQPLKDIVIVGGGTAGWMTAAALSKMLKGQYNIKLVESDQIATIGVGEATIPMINLFNRMLDLDEDDFMRQTQGTFKLGIEFVNWGRIGDRYVHGFGVIGQDGWTVDFYQHWLQQYLAGKASALEHYSINNVAAMHNKFTRARPELGNSPLSQIVHAYQFDASLYARFLRNFSETRGVQRVEGKITQVRQRDADNHVTAVVLENGTVIAGDLFIDCSGFRALLIEGAMNTPFEDWSHWLPCDTAIAVPCANAPELTPYTRATAHGAGWQWRIPLQHRIGNGHVFSSKFMSADEAQSILMNNLDGEALAEPRTLRFRTGKRSKAWHGNVVSIGLSCGFIEPLEPTSIHLIQMAIAHLISYFPSGGFEAADIRQYNRVMDEEYRWARDFVILHYKATERDDTRFWNYCRQMEVPEDLQHRIDLFRSHGRVFRDGLELFTQHNWLQVLHGQRVRPRASHPLVGLTGEAQIDGLLKEVESVIRNCVGAMPTQAAFIAAHCAAPIIKTEGRKQ